MIEGMILGDLRIKAPRPDLNVSYTMTPNGNSLAWPSPPRHQWQAGRQGLALAPTPRAQLERAESHNSSLSDDDCNTPCGEVVARTLFAPAMANCPAGLLARPHLPCPSQPTSHAAAVTYPVASLVAPDSLVRAAALNEEHLYDSTICMGSLCQEQGRSLAAHDKQIGYASADSLASMDMVQEEMPTTPAPNRCAAPVMDMNMMQPQAQQLLEASPAATSETYRRNKSQRTLFGPDGMPHRRAPGCPVAVRPVAVRAGLPDSTSVHTSTAHHPAGVLLQINTQAYSMTQLHQQAGYATYRSANPVQQQGSWCNNRLAFMPAGPLTY